MSDPARGVAVVIPLYDKAPYVGRALDSVLAQTHPPEEIIVVNDGSTDRGAEIVERYAGRGVRALHQDNRGPGAARNRGLAASASPRVAFLDADDEWRPEFLERLGRFLDDEPRAAMVGGGCLNGRTDRPLVPPQHVLPDGSPQGIVPAYFRAMQSDFFLNASSAMLRRSACDAAGGFDESVRYGEDPDFLGRIALRDPVGYVAEPLAVYHLEAEGRMGEQKGWRPYPAFVRTARRALAGGQVPPEHIVDLHEFCCKLLIEYVGQLRRVGDYWAARRVLAECHPEGPSLRAAWQKQRWRLRPTKVLRRSLRSALGAGAPMHRRGPGTSRP